MAAFNAGKGSFRSGGYRMAAAAAQLLFRLAQRQQQPGGEGIAAGGGAQQQPLASSPLGGQDVGGPLTALVERAVDYAGAGDAKQAQVLHGAWCATGLFVKVMEDGLHPDRRDRADRVREGLCGPRLRGAVKLLGASAPALLAAVGAAPAPGTAAAAAAASASGLQGLWAARNSVPQVMNCIPAAHAMFNQMDSADGRIDDCVSAADAVTFLTNSANMRPEAARDLQERLLRELQVLSGEPICFMQFVHCYPWLSSSIGRPPGGARAPAVRSQHRRLRSALRQAAACRCGRRRRRRQREHALQ